MAMKLFLVAMLGLAAVFASSPAAPQGLPLPTATWGGLTFKGSTNWEALPPANQAGAFLQTLGPSSPPQWSNQASQSFLLPTQATNTFLGNTTGHNASPTPNTVSQILNTLGYDIIRPPLFGSIVYKDITTGNWQALQPGVTGASLLSGGAGGTANPYWAVLPNAVAPGIAGTCLISNGPSAIPSYQDCIGNLVNQPNTWTALQTFTAGIAGGGNGYFNITNTGTSMAMGSSDPSIFYRADNHSFRSSDNTIELMLLSPTSGGVTITPRANTLFEGLTLTQTAAGTSSTAPLSLNSVTVNDYATAQTSGLQISHVLLGTAWATATFGQKTALSVSSFVDGTPTTSGYAVVALSGAIESTINTNGASLFAQYGQAIGRAGSSGGVLIGNETDCYIDTAATWNSCLGVQAILTSTKAGTNGQDSAFLAGSFSGIGWDRGYGFYNNAIKSTGIAIGMFPTNTMSVASFMDLTGVTPSVAFIKGTGFSISPAGIGKFSQLRTPNTGDTGDLIIRFPNNNTETLLSLNSSTTALFGIDLSPVTFDAAGAAFRSTGFSVGSTGAVFLQDALHIVSGSGGGSVILSAAATASNFTIKFPAGSTDFSATGGTSQVVKQTSSGGAFTVARLACSDLSDASTGCSASSGITALTGDVTATGPGSVAATVARINGVALGSTAATSANLLIGSGSQWVTQAMSGDITIGSTGVTAIGSAKVQYAQIQNIGALALMGRSANSSGVGANISATAASDAVLRESGSTIGFGTIATGGIANNAVTLAKLATQAANTEIANVTNSTAIPTAAVLPTGGTTGCSAAGEAAKYTAGTGWGCNTAITAAAVPASGLTGATLASGVTASSLTSLGTIAALTSTAATATSTLMVGTTGNPVAGTMQIHAAANQNVLFLSSGGLFMNAVNDANSAFIALTTNSAGYSFGGSGGVQIGAPTGGDKGAGTINAAGVYWTNGTAGVTCGPGAPTAGFQVIGGIVVAC